MKTAFIPATEIDAKEYETFKTLVKEEGKKVSEVLREYVRTFIDERIKKKPYTYKKSYTQRNLKHFMVNDLPFDSSDNVDKDIYKS